MDDPELITRAADCDVVAFLVQIFRSCVSARQLAVVWWSVDHREKDDISFVALKLRGIPAEQSVLFKHIW